MSRYQKDKYFCKENLKGVIKNIRHETYFDVNSVMYLDSWESLASLDFLEDVGVIQFCEYGEMTQYNTYFNMMC